MAKQTAQKAPIKASISMKPEVHAAAVASAQRERRSLSSWVALTVEEKLARARGSSKVAA